MTTDKDKLQALRREIDVIDDSIHDLIMEAIDLFKEKAEEKQIELITHVHTNVPTRVIGDAGRLRRRLRGTAECGGGEGRRRLSWRPDERRGPDDAGPPLRSAIRPPSGAR